MKKKQVKHFFTFLTTALTCASLCTFILTGNPAPTIPGIEGQETIQNTEETEENNDNEEPGISPQNDRNDTDKSEIKHDNSH